MFRLCCGAADAGIDVGTLASLLGHSKLVMVMRYVHPGEAHRSKAVKRLATINAARQIAEFEKKKQSEDSARYSFRYGPRKSGQF